MDAVIVELYEGTIWPWIVTNGLVAVWALRCAPRRAVPAPVAVVRHRGLAQAIIAAHVLFAVIAQSKTTSSQASLLLYGLVAFMSCGMVSFVSQRDARPAHLLYGLGGLWLMGLGIRAESVVGLPSGAVVPDMIDVDDFAVLSPHDRRHPLRSRSHR